MQYKLSDFSLADILQDIAAETGYAVREDGEGVYRLVKKDV